ncbi:hypothetical protein COK36_12640 [Bacillus cereus]|uniref:toll/interleukin-1 receptor domain-containing protein n=1 Tax=Bacillus cereus TaxID=1396 RepID=UPI000BF44DC0|nr:toll/interleukin-1 receptor domain-containing protein [Bacillus cereus]PFR60366.1 hypothetical protein COK36_12640 [Bacillus cereus]
MKVFLSWSGNESKQLAGIFKDWLPNVIQYVKPYMSAQDIAMGERWNNNITNNLEQSDFGLIFVTPFNINAPWINFEAGALSKTIHSKVIPILYNADVMILNQGPLKQFQSAKKLDKENIFSLLQSINESNEVGKLSGERLEKSFEMWWPDLEKEIGNIIEEDSVSGNEEEQEPTEKELLNVIYSKLVDQEKKLAKNQISQGNVGQVAIRANVPKYVRRHLLESYYLLKDFQMGLNGDVDEISTDNLSDMLDKGMSDLERVVEYFGGSDRIRDYETSKI